MIWHSHKKTLYSFPHQCWWPGAARNQGIISPDIDKFCTQQLIACARNGIINTIQWLIVVDLKMFAKGWINSTSGWIKVWFIYKWHIRWNRRYCVSFHRMKTYHIFPSTSAINTWRYIYYQFTPATHASHWVVHWFPIWFSAKFLLSWKTERLVS